MSHSLKSSDSDSGSSVHCGRAGSSPASRTKQKKDILSDVLFLFGQGRGLNNVNATVRWTVAGEGGAPRSESMIV